MSDYTKTTDFAAKDALVSGNPSKAVSGTEIDTEFDNIAVAVATKHDTATVASATVKGIVELATNAETSTGTDSTRAVTPAAIAALLASVPSNIAFQDTFGISFAATSDAAGMTSELFDDYEAGTWTPDFSDLTNSASYTARNGYYVKIARLVLVAVFLDISSLGSVSGGTYIKDLPYAVSSDTNTVGVLIPASGQGWTITAGYVPVGLPVGAQSYIQLGLWDAANGPSALQHSEVNATGNQLWAGFYLTD